MGPYYERDENGLTYYGLNFSSPVPLLNTGRPLVRQREAEYHRDQVASGAGAATGRGTILAMLVKWKQAQQAAARTRARFEPIRAEVERMQRLYDAGQADLIKLLQVQRRFIETRNVELDATWAATQAYADVLAATGGTTLLSALGVR